MCESKLRVRRNHGRGTGIGLIRNICPAKELVEEARGGAGTLLASLAPQYI